MKIKEQNSSRVKFSPYLNQSWFDSPVLLEYSEATRSGFAASLSSTCFDSPCFLVLWDLISNLLPPMKINQLRFVVSFLLAPWTFSCTFACLCSSLSLTSICSLPSQAVEELQKKDQWFQENHNQLSAEEEDDFLTCCSEIAFRIHILALRLNRYWEWLPK